MEEKPKRIYFEEDYDEIMHPDYRSALNGSGDDTPIVYGNSISGEDLAETGAIVFAFLSVCVLVLAAIGILFCIMYFK